MTLDVIEQEAGLRLDQFLARRFTQASRARLQQWIKTGLVLVNGARAKAAVRLRGGERVEVLDEGALPAPPRRAFAEEIPLEILYEDDDLVALHKPAGMTVHAGGGVTSGTLVNALLHYFARLSTVGGEMRPGIVHRLDRLTSGVLLVAKADAAHQRLAKQFAARRVRKIYVALVHGQVQDAARGRPVIIDGVRWTRLEAPISRDRRRRVRMTAGTRTGREAVTDFRVREQWPGFSLLEVCIGTGRTHQIRVHLAAIGHPVVGDTLYGAPSQPRLKRFFLHARQIGFAHPSTGQPMTVEAPLPAELEDHLAALRAGRSALVRK